MVSGAIPSPLIELSGVEKVFRTGKVEYRALRGVDLTIAPGEMVAVVGPSGSGKSTVLNMITGIDRPTAGAVTFDGRRLDELSEEQLAAWRGENVGIIFQFFQLLPALSLLKNVMLPMDLVKKLPRRDRVERATALLDLVGLADQAHKLPSQVSGGQQQRAAIARALANDPPLLVADEPTGNLDSTTAENVFQLFLKLVADGKTLVMVTHSRTLAARGSRVVEIRDGVIASDSSAATRPQKSSATPEVSLTY